MKARQLEVFRMVMRSGTLTAAAEALNVSQPALSQTLMHTEDELGFKLFERNRGRLLPTAEARELFPEVDRIFDDLEHLRERAFELRQGKGRTIRLAASGPPAMSFVPAALNQFRSRHPEVRITCHVIPGENVVKMVERGEVSVGVMMTDEIFPLLDTQVVGTTSIACILPSNHPLAQHEALHISDLQDQTLITYRENTMPRTRIVAALSKAGHRLRPDIEIDGSFSALAFVQQGLGVALIDGLVSCQAYPDLVTVPLLPNIPLPVGVLTAKSDALSRYHLELHELLTAACQAFPNSTS